jgi:hypothetical protein
MRTGRRQQPSVIDDEGADDDDPKEWRRIERERLQSISFRGTAWVRWEEAPQLTGLKRPVHQIKLAARAFVHWLVHNNNGRRPVYAGPP